LKSLHSNYNDILLDYVPFLPELKVSSDLKNTDRQSASAEDLSLYLCLLPMTEIEITIFQKDLLLLSTVYEFTINSQDMSTLEINSNNNVISINILNINQLDNILVELSNRYDIIWIEEKFKMYTQLKYAIGITQSDYPQKNTINWANLTGQDHIVGVADTGIDPYSCYFYDSNYEYPYDSVNSNHRKVIYYQTTYGDAVDSYGHGTEVSNVIAGECDTDSNTNTDNHNGVAYNAKLAFADIGTGTCTDDDGSSCVLSPPSNAYNNLYKVLYSKGARVLSMSWGSTSNKYTTDARYVDQFMYDYPDAILLFAAGNSGTDGVNTVGTPATNKNGVAVGATLNDVLSWSDLGVEADDDHYFDDGVSVVFSKYSLADFSSKGPTDDGRVKPDICGVGTYI
jgi:hypothetical protein